MGRYWLQVKLRRMIKTLDCFVEFLQFCFCSFAIGGDGKAYEGRGFNKVGAHAPKYNKNSIGIVLIGSWESKYLFILKPLLLTNFN